MRLRLTSPTPPTPTTPIIPPTPTADLPVQMMIFFFFFSRQVLKHTTSIPTLINKSHFLQTFFIGIQFARSFQKTSAVILIFVDDDDEW